MFEIYSVVFEVYIGNELANKQTMQAPKEILMMQFINTVKQFANDKRPIKLKMIVSETIWDKYEKKTKILNNYIEFLNKAMEGFEGQYNF